MPMPNLMELFGRKPDAPAPVAEPVPVAQTASPESVLANKTIPSSETGKSDGSLKAIPAAGEGDKSPLANFDGLWDPLDPKLAKETPSLKPNWNIDPAKIREGASKMNFAGAVPTAVMDKAIAGDKSAFAQAINLAAQAGFAKSAETTANLIQTALERQEEVFTNHVMPKLLREHNISNTIRADNPIFQNPAVAPVLAALEQQLTVKNPTSTPEDISRMAKEYLGGMAELVATANGQQIVAAVDPTKATKSKRETDWSKYFAPTAAT